MKCRAGGCQETATLNGLCEGHYRERKETVDAQKPLKSFISELKNKYITEPKFRNLTDFAPRR